MTALICDDKTWLWDYISKSKKERPDNTLLPLLQRVLLLNNGAVHILNILVPPESTQGIRSPGQGMSSQPSSHGTDHECYWLEHTIFLCMFLVTLNTALASPDSVPFSPTNGSDQVKTSMKFGSQYGWGEQLNCLMFITLFSYFNTAAETKATREGIRASAQCWF